MTSFNGLLNLLEIAEQPDIVTNLVGGGSDAGHGLGNDKVNLASAFGQLA